MTTRSSHECSSSLLHLDLLGRLSRLLISGRLRALVLAGAKDEEIFSVLSAADGIGGKS